MEGKEGKLLCSELRELLGRYCSLKGIRLDENTNKSSCVMPNGAILELYAEPLSHTGDYGSIKYITSRSDRFLCIGEKVARFLSEKLSEEIGKMELQANRIDKVE